MGDRHQFRADWHDYNEGIFFITVCCAQKIHYFGEIKGGKMIPTYIGQIIKSTIDEVTDHFPEAEVWNSVVMPNHIHLVIAVGTRHGASASATGNADDTTIASASSPILSTAQSQNNYGCLKPKRHEPSEDKNFHHNSRLAVIVGQIKSTVTRAAKKQNIEFGWQKKYHEHIIRKQQAYENIMYYIDTNVENWCYDRFNPDHIDNADAPWRVPTDRDYHES